MYSDRNQDPGACPGIYCGRLKLENGSLDECRACPKSYRVFEGSSECVLCTGEPQLYDWLYLGFMALLLLLAKLYVIDTTLKRRSFTKDVVLLHFCACLETALATLVCLLCVEPIGRFNLKACGVRKLSDWYTLLHNPSPDYGPTLRCTQEATYPLYSLVFLHNAFALLFLLLFRPLLIHKFLQGKGKTSVFLTMYIVPGLTLIHATAAGLLYYAFPFIIIVLSIVSIAAHFAFRLDQSMSSLFWNTVKDPRNLVILIGHWALHSYGIIALTELRDLILHASLIALVPFPAAFYILTSKFTDPNKLHTD